MSDDLNFLNEDHVRQLGRIIEVLERSTFDYLQIDVGDLKVTLGKGLLPTPDAAAPGPQPTIAPQGPAEPRSTVQEAVPPPQRPADAQAELAEITSPIMGMFYARPEPGAPPFVTVGAIVAEDSTVGLVEVMKTFNAVLAGLRGKIVEVCVPDTQLVEYGQVLFRVASE